jgi:hypothetical protein
VTVVNSIIRQNRLFVLRSRAWDGYTQTPATTMRDVDREEIVSNRRQGLIRPSVVS